MPPDGASPDSRGADSTAQRHEAALLRYAWRLTGNEQAARDVVQETYLRLLREPPGAVNGHLSSWLYRVCRHRALDLLRKERRMRPLEIDTVAVAESPTMLVEQRDEAGRLLALVATLPEREQEIVRLRFEEGLGNKEIAEVLELSASNVGYLLHQAIGKLRKGMGDRG